MWKYIIGYFIFQLSILAFFFFLSWKKDRRYKEGNLVIPEGYNRTEEVMIDPGSGKKQRVYYNKESGRRIYVKEE